jgi:hypothetical protein
MRPHRLCCGQARGAGMPDDNLTPKSFKLLPDPFHEAEKRKREKITNSGQPSSGSDFFYLFFLSASKSLLWLHEIR